MTTAVDTTTELARQGLRIAADDEAGWTYRTAGGERAWVTDAAPKAPAFTPIPREIIYDRETRDYAMYLDGELTGFARTYGEAEMTLNELALNLELDTRATTADMAAGAAAKRDEDLAAQGLRLADEDEAGWWVLVNGGKHVWATDAPPRQDNPTVVPTLDAPISAPARTVDELRAELDAVTDAIQARKTVGVGYSNLSAMRDAIITELDAAHRREKPTIRVTDFSHPYYGMIISQTRIDGPQHIGYRDGGVWGSLHVSQCEIVTTCPSCDDPSDGLCGACRESGEGVPAPVARRACGGAHHIQACNEVRAALLAPDEQERDEYDQAQERDRDADDLTAIDQVARMAADDPCADVRARLERAMTLLEAVAALVDASGTVDTETHEQIHTFLDKE